MEAAQIHFQHFGESYDRHSIQSELANPAGYKLIITQDARIRDYSWCSRFNKYDSEFVYVTCPTLVFVGFCFEATACTAEAIDPNTNLGEEDRRWASQSEIPKLFLYSWPQSEEPEVTLRPQQAIDDIVRVAIGLNRSNGHFTAVDYASEKAAQASDGTSVQEEPVKPYGTEKPAATRDAHRQLDEILAIVRRLERIVSEHPVVLKPDDVYLRELYTRAINESRKNLHIFEHDGSVIPYVLVHSHDIEGNVGRVTRNLYFVARDKAPEDWQQKIIALHESMCIVRGHDQAKVAELPLARLLGKEKEYAEWRDKIDNSCKDRKQA